MTPLSCQETRRHLQAFHDGELGVSEQIGVRAHVEWCDDCAAALEDMQAIGAALRGVLPGRGVLEPEVRATFPPAVVSRLKAERTMAWPARLEVMFEDGHLLYAGAAAVVAAFVCGVVLLGVMRAALTPEPDSLAALIDVLTPGSNQNPVVPRPNVLMPKPLDHAFSADADDLDAEALITLAATVTREGRVANLSLLSGTDPEGHADGEEARAVAHLMDAVSRARFEPASVAGSPVAVNMVWMVARTTVRGTAIEPEPAGAPPAKKRRVASLADSIEAALRQA